MFKRRKLEQKSDGVGYDVVEVDEPIHPKNLFLLAYWRSKMGPDGIVRRSDVNPFDFRRILGGVFLVEPIDEGRDLIYRLVGSQNEQRLATTFTGRRFSECYGEAMTRDQVAFHARVFAGGKPAFLRGKLKGTGVDYAEFEASYLPLRTENGGYQMVGGMFDLAEPE